VLGNDGRAKTSAGPSTGTPPALGLRVLLAEDNSVNQKVALRMLEKWGCRADAVANGKEALTALETTPYDIVLMDVQMPEMDGLEATGCIRKREEGGRRHIPVIALTAHSMTGDRERCLEAGMDDYVSKPIRPDELLDTLRRWHQALNDSAIQRPALSLVGGSNGAEPEWPVFDREQLWSSCEDEETVCEVVADFLAVTPVGIARLDKAVATGDRTGIQYEAHTLKGSCRTVGAEALAHLCEQIEHHAHRGELADAVAKHAGVAREWVRLEPLLSAGLARHAA
jgi:CheY-like chemotaxis protein/HPt (histidine-containing phosphotransfer) domain-containing protein